MHSRRYRNVMEALTEGEEWSEGKEPEGGEITAYR